ncbi:MAG: DivIVA domain-containing protein [Acidimicrobiia bacterium]|nr:DivIVA domain-containing protein [Acidimicrobiia bacterium]
MELSPQQLCDVEFSEQWRGYNRDQVDDFIERVAAAVSQLQERLKKMTERAVRAEQRGQEGSEADGAARRTLVLAQRTADATIAEAKDTAARLVAQAQEEARAIILAAESSASAVSSVEPTARAEIADLEVTRSRLQADVAALESHVTDRRARIKSLLDELTLRVDEGFDGRIAQWPSAGDSPVGDDFADDTDDLGDVDDVIVLDDGDDVSDAMSNDVDTASADQVADDDLAEDEIVDLAPAPPAWEPPEPALDDDEPPEIDDYQPDDITGAMPVPEFTDLSPRDVDDDAFFAHLRGALDDDAPLGPREDASGLLRWREETATAVAEAPSLYDQGEPERRKFGRKKRRTQ